MKNDYQKIKKEKQHRRCNRTRAKIKGTGKIPRFSVFRSSRHIWCQLINDKEGKTILSLNDIESKKPKTESQKIEKKKKTVKKKKTEIAYEIGKLIAGKALKNKIKRVVFDRGAYKYHGRVKALAEGARKGGLEF